jgi:hypothetical protein
MAPDGAADTAAILAELRRVAATHATRPAKQSDPAEVERASERLRQLLGLDPPGFQTLSASFPELQPVAVESFDIEGWVARAYAVIDRQRKGVRKHGPHPDPIPQALLEQVVRLRAEKGASIRAIALRTGLSRYKATKIVKLVDDHKIRLRRDRLEFDVQTSATPDGVILLDA